MPISAPFYPGVGGSVPMHGGFASSPGLILRLAAGCLVIHSVCLCVVLCACRAVPCHALAAVFMLSCNFPRRPDFGDVTVMDLHSGGVAHFHCHLGYELQGPRVLTCINASRPHWNSPEPICSGTASTGPSRLRGMHLGRARIAL